MRAKTAVRPSSGEIVFTGQRRNDHFRLDLAGRSVWLASIEFIALIDLVVSRIETDAGNMKISRSTIHRLRKSLGRPGDGLIESAGSGEYHLTILQNHIAVRLRLTPCFFEVIDLGLISTDHSALLRKRCRVRKLRD